MPPTPSRAEQRDELRAKLGALLPVEFDTEFQTDRWLDSYHGDVNACAEKYAEYIRNRRALGYDRAETLDAFYSRADVLRFHRVFRVSRLDAQWVNEADNGLVFVEMGIGDPDVAMAEFSIGEYLRVFFGYCEYFQRLILRHEARSGRRSHGVCIFDMRPMNMFQYANPYAPVNRLLQARVNVWMSYYGEMLRHIVIVNPPRLIGAFFKMLSFLLPEHAVGRFLIARSCPNDIEKLISRSAIPKCYGGDKPDELFTMNGNSSTTASTSNDSSVGKKEESCHNGEKQSTNSYNIEDELNLACLRDRYGIGTSHAEEYNILPGESFRREFEDARADRVFFYEFSANRDLEATFIDENGDYLMARFKLATPVRPECDTVRISSEYGGRRPIFEVKNLSKLMKMKLKISIQFVQ